MEKTGSAHELGENGNFEARGDGRRRLTMTSRHRRLIRLERDLEDVLVANPELLDVLIIGRQVRTPNGAIDLLAIDATGIVHIIELKLGDTTPKIIAQVLDYHHWLKVQSRDEIIRVAARAPLYMDLPAAFEKYFGHPLPAPINHARVITMVAASIDARTGRNIQTLNEERFSIRAFRYFEQRGSVGLIPHGHPEQDIQISEVETRPVVLPERSTPAVAAVYRARVDADIQLFWQIFAERFTWTFVPFSFVYALYEHWHYSESAPVKRLRPFSIGQFGRQMSALIAESHQWTRLRRAPEQLMDCYEPMTAGLTNWTRPDAEKVVVGYLRNSIQEHGHSGCCKGDLRAFA
ncbi:hypothetical protein G3T36_02125 [Diaminobutyricibacter tongyongensis]|uniref:DUF91 domain-containing protein n=1 Tax=Leifsonia tongyongensis TaxID=1268043 RepID=A0A6L9XUF9_9MICO|nr:hypothetical protein [Diaminobutyricibacter tongyongensis]NEN04658.1 hypothetical protein [Diaminobutyricibacter tongyongensis]